ncbi:hypothetical protein VNO77_35413 [Canavalia gladiata]|uniref:Uncharacterized protein n=1 Tax=Canavalia gladiata TaxID=3824 RepID=A0AAN9PXQ7_CANGL
MKMPSLEFQLHEGFCEFKLVIAGMRVVLAGQRFLIPLLLENLPNGKGKGKVESIAYAVKRTPKNKCGFQFGPTFDVYI